MKKHGCGTKTITGRRTLRKHTLAKEHVAPRALEGEIVKSAAALELAKEVWGAQGYDIEAEERVVVLAEPDE